MKYKIFIFFLSLIFFVSCQSLKLETAFNMGVDYAIDELQKKHSGGTIRVPLDKSGVEEYYTPMNFIHYQIIQVKGDSTQKDSLIVPYRINYPVVKDSIKNFGKRHFFKDKKQTSQNMLEENEWAIDFDHSSIARLMKNKIQQGNFAMSDFEDVEQKKSEKIKEEDTYIALIFIQNVLTKRGDKCTYGMQQIANMVYTASQDEEVKGIILMLDSPGGTVKGTEELAEYVYNCSKPVIAYVDGDANSAAYWIASQADVIIANTFENCHVGSIGIYGMHTDNSKKLENEGVKVTFIQAGEDKTKGNSYTPLDANWLAEKQEDINSTHIKFKEFVNRKRQIPEMAMTGKSYKKEKALELNLIDKIGTYADAIAEIDFLYRKDKLLNT